MQLGKLQLIAAFLWRKGKATDVGAEESVISFVQLQLVVSVLVCLYTTVSGVVARGQEIKVIFEFVSFLWILRLSVNYRKMLLTKNAKCVKNFCPPKMQNVELKTAILAEEKFWTPIISRVKILQCLSKRCLSKKWKLYASSTFLNLRRHWRTNIICHLLVRSAPNAFYCGSLKVMDCCYFLRCQWRRSRKAGANYFLVRPKTIVFGRTYVLLQVFFLLFFLPTRDLRDAWADRREILHDGQY